MPRFVFSSANYQSKAWQRLASAICRSVSLLHNARCFKVNTPKTTRLTILAFWSQTMVRFWQDGS